MSLLIVAIVDLALVVTLFLYIVLIKCISRRHNLTLKCRKVFNVIAVVLFISYLTFITAVAIANHVQRSQMKVDYS